MRRNSKTNGMVFETEKFEKKIQLKSQAKLFFYFLNEEMNKRKKKKIKERKKKNEVL